MGKSQGQWSSLPRMPGQQRSSVGTLPMTMRGGMTKRFGTPTRRRVPPTPDHTARWERHANDLMRNHWQPEVRLWATVLVDAVKCLRAEGRLRDEVLEWVREEDPMYTLGTFDGVCCQLDLDPEWVRGDLLSRPFLRAVA